MIRNIMSLLESTTPALRQRYLERIRSVKGREARELEQRLVSLIERDTSKRTA